MTVLLMITLGLVVVTGTVVVLTDSPRRQAVAVTVYGVLLAPVFLLLGAPDVALSQIAGGTGVVPLMVLLAVRVVQRKSRS